jgi:hypothetical protein
MLAFLAALALCGAQAQQAGAPFLLIGCEDGHDDEILTAFSRDGIAFSSNPAWKPGGSLRFMRDQSLIYYTDKLHKPYWLCACSAATALGSAVKDDTFALATSDDLIHWTLLQPIAPGGIKGAITRAWSPYLFQDPADGAVYVFVTISTEHDWMGIGYMKCLNPGAWTRWTDWQSFAPLQHQELGRYNGAAVYHFGGKYRFFFDDYSGRNGYPSAEAYITSPTSLLSGYGPPTYIHSFNSALSLDHNFLTEPLKDYRYEGMSLVWMRDGVWRIYDQAIGKVNGIPRNDIIGFVESEDNLRTWGAFHVLRGTGNNDAIFSASHVYRLDTLKP